MQKARFWTCTGALLCGLLLSLISWIQLCSETCKIVHAYKLFGTSFETIGFIFFPLALSLHFLGNRKRWAYAATGFLLATASGSEISFILVQKYEIEQWCPLCLSIAGTVGIATGIYIVDFFKRSHGMRSFWIALSALCFMCIGLGFANLGITKDEPFVAAEKELQETLYFGKRDSQIETYFFTDWQCPACRALEPSLAHLAPQIMERGSLIFADTIVHVDTLNYVPYNLSFMIHDKSNYLLLRSKLSDLSKVTGRPSDEEIAKTIAPMNYQQLTHADVALGNRLFKSLADQFEVISTPTMVIVNKETKKKKTLVGKEISEAKVLKAIRTLERSR